MYCPAGSGSPTTVSSGYYSSGGSTSSTHSGQTQCERGYYCVSGVRSACPAGKYRASAGASSLSDCLACTAGYYCSLASSVATETRCGLTSVYCPAESAAPTAVQPGFYSTGGSSSTRSDETQCERGYYCVSGERFACPAGRYRASAGGTSLSECLPCMAGYLCPAASFASTATAEAGNNVTACGATSVFCPAGTPTAIAVSRGFYTTPEDGDETTRTWQEECGLGSCIAASLASARVL